MVEVGDVIEPLRMNADMEHVYFVVETDLTFDYVAIVILSPNGEFNRVTFVPWWRVVE